MRNRQVVLSLAFLAACSSSASPVEGTAISSVPTTVGGVEASLLVPADEVQLQWVESAAQKTVELPEGTFPLGYVPSPIKLPEELKGQPGSGSYSVDAVFPATYDLRAQKKVTAVRNQGSCGSCWAFASMASSESDLLPAATTDFSEEHLNLTHGFDLKPCNGGNSWMSVAYMTRGSGPASEADVPYTGTVHAIAKVPAQQTVIKEWLNFPNRTGPLDNTNIKSAVTTYGALFTTMNFINSAWNAKTNSFYYGTASGANHAVAIVGWNDAYPATNFGSKPAGNGAFLVRNSWGTAWGDGGYFWISYYDATIGRDLAAFASFGPTTDFDTLFQWDKLGQTTTLSFNGATAYSGALFTTAYALGLKAVGFYTTAASSTVTVQIYSGATTSPNSGKLVGTATATEAWQGYHTVDLSAAKVALGANAKFGVVVAVTSPTAKSYVSVEYPMAGYSSGVVAKAGSSFVSTDGKTWTDAATSWKANIPIKVLGHK